jgi:hypothetical protein
VDGSILGVLIKGVGYVGVNLLQGSASQLSSAFVKLFCWSHDLIYAEFMEGRFEDPTY